MRLPRNRNNKLALQAFKLSSAWFVPYYLDVGAGDSYLTWQALAGIGYKFKWGETAAFWRYLS
jgi:hypothetical protein